MDQGVGVAEVVEELVAQPLAEVRARHQARHVEQLDGHAAPAADARPVVRLAPRRQLKARARARNLQIANRALRVDGGEAAVVAGYARFGNGASVETTGCAGALRKIACEGGEQARSMSSKRQTTDRLSTWRPSSCSAWSTCLTTVCPPARSTDREASSSVEVGSGSAVSPKNKACMSSSPRGAAWSDGRLHHVRSMLDVARRVKLRRQALMVIRIFNMLRLPLRWIMRRKSPTKGFTPWHAETMPAGTPKEILCVDMEARHAAPPARVGSASSSTSTGCYKT